MSTRLHNLNDWLAHCERLHPKTIDLGLARVMQVGRILGLEFRCPVITVAGTNGKGSTCAMLESILRQAGYRTGVYTSPHLVNFEERLRLNGRPVDASELVAAFARVESARVQEGDAVSLTYFEFSTLAILDVMTRAALDVAVLEVGLGGRLDAVNIVDSDCAVITCIDIDHTELLGPDREAIGYEKAGIMRTGRPTVVSDPIPPRSVRDHAVEIDADLRCIGTDFRLTGDEREWSWVGARHSYRGLKCPALRGGNQLLNAGGVLAALDVLRERLPVSAQAVRAGLAAVRLPGRFQVIDGAPLIVLDVAHNPHAVRALVANLAAMGRFGSTHAVFGAMADKDVKTMLSTMAPLVDHWYFTDLPTGRAESGLGLLDQWRAQSGARSTPAEVYPDPSSALRAAVAAADPADRIAVFGSFYTVGGVLKDGPSSLRAKLKPNI